MRTIKPILLVPGALLLVTAMLHAQAPNYDQNIDAPSLTDSTIQPRKQPGFRRRPKKDTPEQQLILAETLRNAQRDRAARKAYRALVHQWHDSEQAPTAQYWFAKLLEDAGRYERAFEEYQYLMDHYPGLFPYEKVLQLQFAIANHVYESRRYGFLFLPGFRDPNRALPLFEQVVKNGPRWQHAPQAMFLIGSIHEEQNRHEEAIPAYERLTQRFPRSPFAPDARFRRAYCLYRIARSAPRDEESNRTAIAALNGFLRQHPEHAKAEQAQKKRATLTDHLAQLYFARAEFYDTRDHARAAIITYTDFLQHFPSSSLAEKAQARVTELEARVESNP